MTRKNKTRRLKFLREVLESSMLTAGRGFKPENLRPINNKRMTDMTNGKYSAPMLKKIERKTIYK